ncbi:methylase involved in ubiquinone/menaquinone biosynthesis [Burkholderiales bacterium JOSHI_001]|nr:methylase involved in ubiquinone/menaquinone biosynthesis [Burkholderiales bacterium JOSHI_001]
MAWPAWGHHGQVNPDPPYRDDQWWRHHFSGPMLDLWRAIVPVQQALDDADFLVRHLGLQPGQRVLDLPCGEGRVAIELAARGCRATGVDISPGLLALARTRADARGQAVRWIEGDMCQPPAGETFDAVFCWGDSFGYLDDAGNAQFLRAARSALRPGGGFALEVQMLAELLATRFAPQASGRVGELQVDIRRQWQPGQPRMAVQYELRQGAQVHCCHASYRIHTLDGLCGLLRAAGFEHLQALDPAGQPFGSAAQCLRLVARAPG